MKLDDAIAKFEAGRTVVEGSQTFLAQTGEPYTVVTDGGIKYEAEPYPAPAWPTKAEAVENWLKQITAWASDKQGTLYWRRRPRIEEGQPNGFHVSSRQIISDRQPIKGLRT